MAQLGARFHGMEEVIGSIPIRSTKQPLTNEADLGSSLTPSVAESLVDSARHQKRGRWTRRLGAT